ncbi:hypothetical protein KIPB_010669 [Kipferlia bialata]|uniref:Cyclin-like domain-containing protein n=1 Tax=Kipferlia bialata TaxID=797122 RepID=A0A9K3GMI0_9EUKA|nr:hypothetical protein KIPB_010669 [Kipferlia bialata]|eukprot:g10669.t1
MESGNPSYSASYAPALGNLDEFRMWLHKSEDSFRPKADALDTIQGGMSTRVYSVFFHFLHATANALALHPTVASLAVNIFDRYLSHARVGENKLSHLAVASIHLAAKSSNEHISTESVLRCLGESRGMFSREDLILIEKEVLNALEWRLQAVTPYTFLYAYFSDFPESLRLLLENDSDSNGMRSLSVDQLGEKARFFVDLADSEYRFRAYHNSSIAAAAIRCALFVSGADTRDMRRWLVSFGKVGLDVVEAHIVTKELLSSFRQLQNEQSSETTGPQQESDTPSASSPNGPSAKRRHH